MNERGHIPYGKEDGLEQYCYREINNCDILVHIIGGRFGSGSREEPYSISQMELKTAQELKKQVYICVEQSVLVEYRTFLNNEHTPDFRPLYVDDLRIYKFLKEVLALPNNNQVLDFNAVSQITDYLREQWAGLFQRFLQEESRRDDYKISANLKSTAETLASTAETLSEIVQHTTRERDETIKSILIHNHPVFLQLKQAAGIPFRVFFSDLAEMKSLLSAFKFSDDPFGFDEDNHVFERTLKNERKVIRVAQDIFDKSGALKPVEEGQWARKFAILDPPTVNDDETPF